MLNPLKRNRIVRWKAKFHGQPMMPGILAALLFANYSFASTMPSCPAYLERTAGDVPQYPSRNVYRPIEGWTRLTGKLDPEGKLIDLKVVASEPEYFFDESALTAVKSWRFNWRGSWCVYSTTIHFRLAKEESEFSGNRR